MRTVLLIASMATSMVALAAPQDATKGSKPAAEPVSPASAPASAPLTAKFRTGKVVKDTIAPKK